MHAYERSVVQANAPACWFLGLLSLMYASLCIFVCLCRYIVLQSVHIWDCACSAVVSVYVFDVYLGSVSSVIHMGVCVWVYSALCMCS